MLISDFIARLNRIMDKEGDLELANRPLCYGEYEVKRGEAVEVVEVGDTSEGNTFLIGAFHSDEVAKNKRKLLIISQ
jgi:hypothetical protein